MYPSRTVVEGLNRSFVFAWHALRVRCTCIVREIVLYVGIGSPGWEPLSALGIKQRAKHSQILLYCQIATNNTLRIYEEVARTRNISIDLNIRGGTEYGRPYFYWQSKKDATYSSQTARTRERTSTKQDMAGVNLVGLESASRGLEGVAEPNATPCPQSEGTDRPSSLILSHKEDEVNKAVDSHWMWEYISAFTTTSRTPKVAYHRYVLHL